MGKYNIFISKPALKELERLPQSEKERIKNALDYLALSPKKGAQVRKLIGMLSGKYRLRIGNYRAVYMVIDEEHAVYVLDVAHRKDVYR